jgi:hypothetical protein
MIQHAMFNVGASATISAQPVRGRSTAYPALCGLLLWNARFITPAALRRQRSEVLILSGAPFSRQRNPANHRIEVLNEAGKNAEADRV